MWRTQATVIGILGVLLLTLFYIFARRIFYNTRGVEQQTTGTKALGNVAKVFVAAILSFPIAFILLYPLGWVSKCEGLSCIGIWIYFPVNIIASFLLIIPLLSKKWRLLVSRLVSVLTSYFLILVLITPSVQNTLSGVLYVLNFIIPNVILQFIIVVLLPILVFTVPFIVIDKLLTYFVIKKRD